MVVNHHHMPYPLQISDIFHFNKNDYTIELGMFKTYA